LTLTAKHRSSIYSTLSPLIGEEEAEALLSEFPARELDEPVTKDFLRAELAELRAEMNERFRQMTIWVTTVMAAMTTTQIAAVALFT